VAGEPLAADAPVLVFGHGAGAGVSHPWMIRIVADLATRGIRVVTFNFPYMDAGRRVPDPPPVLEAAFASAWKAAAGRGPMFAGGKSMGGRIASQVAARGGFDPAPAGLVFCGYPLHPPGKPAQRRDKHLPAIAAPMLFLHGTRDPFGSPDEMRELVATLPSATLEIIDGGDHSLLAPRQKPAASASLERAFDLAAGWIQEHSSS
jgi:predicted alpha/beta-hydrolase family hydrolase